MKSFRPFALPVLIAVVALLAVAGCRDNRTSIGRILENPDRYLDREVTVAGEVTKVYSAPLIIAEPGIYQIDDGTGLIWVITKYGTPRVGSEVGLKGIVESPIKLLGEHIGAVIREERRKTR